MRSSILSVTPPSTSKARYLAPRIRCWRTGTYPGLSYHLLASSIEGNSATTTPFNRSFILEALDWPVRAVELDVEPHESRRHVFPICLQFLPIAHTLADIGGWRRCDEDNIGGTKILFFGQPPPPPHASLRWPSG